MENFKQKNTQLALFANFLGLIGISITLLIAFYYQLVESELPCPLCLLQRVGLILAGCGFLFNIQQGIKNTHYGMVIIGCIVTGIIAARQMFLHITPGDTGYGSTFMGIHFYTWALLSSVLLIMFVAVIMPLNDLSKNLINLPSLPGANKVASLLFVFLIAGNLVSTVLECGSGQCADNPLRYELLSK
ncbi:MAG: disulfide bond formation protein B [Enterobacterales bacterium endosymbiont of Blomia tropicalis]|uniref:disulfide bond formation protein B n=1 Tax=Mixta mediterraneensis TaxID=2758443 RepID=UPI0025A6D57C|nr:disulfide bond formation protein B [Mixta mediterraneensis]MDL4915751.1 disulfide bond formation protein B [Mixta mediterraneensis]